MSDDGYEKVEVPRGTFVGWGLKPGQKMTARVLSYSDTDGRDFNGETCPLVVAELTEPFTNYRDKGTTQETIDVTLLGRYYERFGDHGVSVARRVTYLVTGVGRPELDRTAN